MTVSPRPAEQTEYNATAVGLRRVHEDLMILNVQPDDALPDYQPGQYTTLGLLTDEPRLGETAHPDDDRHRMILRAYSISCPILNGDGVLVGKSAAQSFEFYIALVRKTTDSPPSLTPRLFAIEVGHRLFLGPRPKGTYTLAPVEPDDNVIFVATGTGEAPHNPMIRELLAREHRGRIASFICVRHKQDLAYLQTHRRLEQHFENYRYIPLTTREPENIDRSHPAYIGKRYLQDVFASDELQTQLGWRPQPENTHVFLCGNPSMIGVPKHDPDGPPVFTDPKGMIETLMERGFQLDRPHHAGNIHFERYW